MLDRREGVVGLNRERRVDRKKMLKNSDFGDEAL
jgi:hypothetical protein